MESLYTVEKEYNRNICPECFKKFVGEEIKEKFTIGNNETTCKFCKDKRYILIGQLLGVGSWWSVSLCSNCFRKYIWDE